jgi:hypothetical protein
MIPFHAEAVGSAPAVRSDCWERLACRLQVDLAREREAHAACQRQLHRALDLLALHNADSRGCYVQGIDVCVQTEPCGVAGPSMAWAAPLAAASVSVGSSLDPLDDLASQELGLLEVGTGACAWC